MHDENCFITLTFNDDNLDLIYSLQTATFQNFMKRLRIFLDRNYWDENNLEWVELKIPFSEMCKKEYSAIEKSSDRVAKPVRFFHAGEYGEKFERPHHHAILFGFDFPDKIFKIKRRGFDYFTSPLLEKLWTNPDTGESLGFSELTSCSFEACAYVARYCTKKVSGALAEEHYDILDEQGNFHRRKAEFATMSRNPGIGLNWYEQFKETDIYAHDSVAIRGGIHCKPPRYYNSKFEISHPVEYNYIKQNRKTKSKLSEKNRYERQSVREKIKYAQSSLLKRSLT